MLKEAYEGVLKELKDPKPTVVVVTKTKPDEMLHELFEADVTDCGENKMQELVRKQQFCVDHEINMNWHLIAPVQTKKIKTLVHPFHYHCLTELKHLDKMMELKTPVQDIFVQVNISSDEAKSGVSIQELGPFLAEAKKRRPIQGLMTILKFDQPPEIVRKEYALLKSLCKEHGLKSCSMGMSDDWKIAAEEGATHLRIGSAIVGRRG